VRRVVKLACTRFDQTVGSCTAAATSDASKLAVEALTWRATRRFCSITWDALAVRGCSGEGTIMSLAVGVSDDFFGR
jgi:hypothetical protein